MAHLPAQRVATFGTSIFAEVTRLAIETKAINLGQGFPDFDGPEEVKAAAMAAIGAGDNQYAASAGQPTLKRAIAAHSQRFYGQDLGPRQRDHRHQRRDRGHFLHHPGAGQPRR